jgi:predicted XRE-type DNA-binding protein
VTNRISPLADAKRRRLESAGWRVGSAAGFLGLTDEEAALLEIRVRLAIRLREARQGRRWTQAQLAERLGSSQSRVAKMEAGDHSVTLDLLIRSLFALGATGREIGRAFASLDRVRRQGRAPVG